MRRLFFALLLSLGFALSAYAQTISITDPVLKWNNQVAAPLNGVWGASTLIVLGHFTGTAPTHVACQIYQSDGTTVVQAWTQLTSETITGSSWRGTLSAPWGGPYKHQCRETNNTAITSAVSTNFFSAGPLWVMAGQSQFDRLWISTSECPGATWTINTKQVKGFVACATNNLFGAWTIGKLLYSSNLTGGQSAIASLALPDQINVSDNALATGTFDAQVEIQTPTVSALGFRLNNTSVGAGVQQVGDAPHGSENNVAHAAGEIAVANDIQAAANSAALLVEAAVGGTASSAWISPSGERYLGTVGLLGSNGLNTNDFSDFFFAQGGTDALNMVSAAVYRANILNIEAWVQGFRANVPFFILPVGIIVPPGSTTDAEADAIRQVHYTAIDTDANVFFGGLDWDCEHATNNVHLTPSGQINCYAPRIIQAWLKQHGQATHGYGPQLDQTSGKWNGGTQFTLNVIHEVVGDTLTSAGLSASGANLTGFRIIDNGNGGAVLTLGSGITSTAFTQPKTLIFNTSAVTCPCVLDYGYGANSPATNLVYSNFPVPGDVNGLPMQHSRGQISMVNTLSGTGGRAGRWIH